MRLSNKDLLKKDVTWVDSLVGLSSQADDFTKTLLLSGGAAGTEAKALLTDAVKEYIRFTDRYYQPGLLDSLLGASATQNIGVPAGLAYYNIQTTLVNNAVVTARTQLLAFAAQFGLTLTWVGGANGMAHPDPTRAAAGERLYELTGISKGSQSVAFEAQHTETVVFNGNSRSVIKDLTGLTLKTTAGLDVAVGVGAVTAIAVGRTDAVNTLAEQGQPVRVHFAGMETADLNLREATGNSDPAYTQLTIDNDLFTGRLTVDGGVGAASMVDKIFIERVKAETVVHAGGGDDEITIGRDNDENTTGLQGLVDEIGASLFLFGDEGTDQIIVNDSADSTGREVTIDKNLLEHSVGFEQLSRITSALSLQGITAAENTELQNRLKAAAVPYGQDAMMVDATDLEAYRDFAAEELLGNIGAAVTNLQTEFDKAVTDTITLLKDRDQALLENQVKLYVRARYYEQGDSGSGGSFVTGSYLGDRILDLMSADNAGMKTWLRYEDRDWYPVVGWKIDWDTSNNVSGYWPVKEGLNEIKEFFEHPNAKFKEYGEAGVSTTKYAKQYLEDIKNLLKDRSLLGLVNEAYKASDKRLNLGGGDLDGDEKMWLYLWAKDVKDIARVQQLAQLYDEAMAEYVGTSGIYSKLLLDRHLTQDQLDVLFFAFKDNVKVRGFNFDNLSANLTPQSSKLIKSVGDPDFNIELEPEYRKLTDGVNAKIDALQSTATGGFKATYTAQINALGTAVANANNTLASAHTSQETATVLNAVVTAANSLKDFLDPRNPQTVDGPLLSEARFIKAPAYNLFATATGNGSIALLGEVAALSSQIAGAGLRRRRDDDQHRRLRDSD